MSVGAGVKALAAAAAGGRLCPRQCGVDRCAGARGFCGAGARVEVYRHGLHAGETGLTPHLASIGG